METYDTYRQLYTKTFLTDNYVKFRPVCSDTFFENVIGEFCKETWTGNELAVDVGCGPGISSLPLTKYYKQVIGVDVSQSQIANAPTDVPGLSFRVAMAENLSFIQSDSVDLVTVCTALHWFQIEKFYMEVDRILKPGGSLVAYTISILHVEGHKELNDYVDYIYSTVLNPYWIQSVKSVFDQKYETMPAPYKDHIRKKNVMTIEKYWTIEDFIGYMNSWISVEKYGEENPETDLMEEVRQKFHEILDHNDNGDAASNKKVYKFEAPIFTIMAHKPTTPTGDNRVGLFY